MKETDIATARLNIKISINRLIFRSKLSNVMDDKRKVIQSEANDLNYALNVFRMLQKDNEYYEVINNSLRLEILYLKQELNKQQETIEL